MERNTAMPKLCAYVMLRSNDKIAMVCRANTGWMDGYWGLIGGKVENNETFSAAAIREAKEEAGITIDPSQLRMKTMVQLHDTDSDWIDVVFEATEWSGEPHNAEPHMHSELQWFGMSELPENTIPVAKVFLESIAQDNPYTEFGWNEK